MTHSRHTSTHLRCAAVAALVLLLTPALAAQNSGRGFIKGQAGTSFDNIGSGFTAAGGFGVRLTESLDLFAEAGTMQDAMTPALRNELAAAAELISRDFTVPLELTGTLPAQYGLFGSRITVPLRSVVTPFFEIGCGAARLSYDLESSIGGVIHSPFFRDFFHRELLEVRFMLSASAGAHLAVTRHIGFDFAYRYFRISTDAPSLAGSQVYVGIVYRF